MPRYIRKGILNANQISRMRIIFMKCADHRIFFVVDDGEISSARYMVFSILPRRSGIDHQVIGAELQNFKL